MFDGAAMLMTVFYGLFAEGRWEDRRHANVLDGAAHYYRTYETADGKHFAVGAMEPQFYAELCERLGVTVPQEDTPEAWAAHGDTMAARFREKTRAEWEAELVTPQSCASPVLGLAEAPNHPHSRARGSFVTVDGVVQPAPAPRFSRTAAIGAVAARRSPATTPSRSSTSSISSAPNWCRRVSSVRAAPADRRARTHQVSRFGRFFPSRERASRPISRDRIQVRDSAGSMTSSISKCMATFIAAPASY